MSRPRKKETIRKFGDKIKPVRQPPKKPRCSPSRNGFAAGPPKGIPPLDQMEWISRFQTRPCVDELNDHPPPSPPAGSLPEKVRGSA